MDGRYIVGIDHSGNAIDPLSCFTVDMRRGMVVVTNEEYSMFTSDSISMDIPISAILENPLLYIYDTQKMERLTEVPKGA